MMLRRLRSIFVYKTMPWTQDMIFHRVWADVNRLSGKDWKVTSVDKDKICRLTRYEKDVLKFKGEYHVTVSLLYKTDEIRMLLSVLLCVNRYGILQNPDYLLKVLKDKEQDMAKYLKNSRKK